MDLIDFCRWLERTDWATALRESGYFYPFVEGSHVMALALSVGTVLWFDLRLLGLRMVGEPVSTVFRQVRPWMFAGFAIMVATGALLFSTRAVVAYQSGYFRLKVVLLVLGAANALVFHATIDRRRADWDSASLPPLQARLAGGASILLWFGIIAAGRIMAYNL